MEAIQWSTTIVSWGFISKQILFFLKQCNIFFNELDPPKPHFCRFRNANVVCWTAKEYILKSFRHNATTKSTMCYSHIFSQTYNYFWVVLPNLLLNRVDCSAMHHQQRVSLCRWPDGVLCYYVDGLKPMTTVSHTADDGNSRLLVVTSHGYLLWQSDARRILVPFRSRLISGQSKLIDVNWVIHCPTAFVTGFILCQPLMYLVIFSPDIKQTLPQINMVI